MSHGGPDALGVPAHDFSTNANAAAPFGHVSAALQAVDRTRYPDPAYTALRERLSRQPSLQGASPARLLPTAGTSEAIRRLTLAAALDGVSAVHVPCPGYGDYAAAARALGLAVHPWSNAAALADDLAAAADRRLAWVCEPASPTGATLTPAVRDALARAVERGGHVLALDRAYEPLRLEGQDPVTPALARLAWSCWSPNKALATPGVRAGWMVAPEDRDESLRQRSAALAPSWVLSAEGVALVEQFHDPRTQDALRASRQVLATWAGELRAMLASFGWEQAGSVTPFWVARPPGPVATPALLAQLRTAGVKLRDTTSMGLPGWARLSAQPAASQRALREALRSAASGS